VQHDASAVDVGQAGDEAEDRALAAAARAQQDEELPVAHFERHVVDDGVVVVLLDQAFELNRHLARLLTSVTER
jgi:hypothetical protein